MSNFSISDIITEISSIEVRESNSDEISLIRDLFDTVFTETFSAHIPEFEEATKGEKIYAAFFHGKIVGMASVWEPDKFVHYLFVHPEYRSREIGRTLVSHLAEIYETLTLKCLISNKNGLAFYSATGWEQVDTGECEDGEYILLCYSKK